MTYARLVGLAAFLTIVGCTGDDNQCALYDRAGFAPQEYRDPQSGTCQSFGGYCDDPCQPCPATGAEIAQPDWAVCYGSCEGLGEAACKSTSGCRAIYEGNAFYECWGVAPSGAIPDDGCAGLDAYQCSRHDDCIARHADGSPIGSFMSCEPEGSVGDPGSCVGEVTCLAAPPDCPAGTIAGRRNGCWTGYCIPYAQCDQLPECSTLDEMDCISRSDCAPTYEGHNCTCSGTSCTCQTWTFDACKMK